MAVVPAWSDAEQPFVPASACGSRYELRHVRFRTIGCSKLGGTSTEAVSRGVAPYRAAMSSKKVAPRVKLVAVIAPLATPLRPTPAK